MLNGFTFTLGYSRAMMAESALDQKLGTLLKMDEEAFDSWVACWRRFSIILGVGPKPHRHDHKVVSHAACSRPPQRPGKNSPKAVGPSSAVRIMLKRPAASQHSPRWKGLLRQGQPRL